MYKDKEQRAQPRAIHGQLFGKIKERRKSEMKNKEGWSNKRAEREMRKKAETIHYLTGQAGQPESRWMKGKEKLSWGPRESERERERYEMKTNKPSSIPSCHCCSVPLKGRHAFLLLVSTGGREGQLRSGERGRGEMVKIYLSRGGWGGGVAVAAAAATAALQNSWSLPQRPVTWQPGTQWLR